MFNSGVVAAIL